MNKERLNILILPRWYPVPSDPMLGLFIQRQAEILAHSHQVSVLFVHFDQNCPNDFEIEYAYENNVQVIRVYYRIQTPSFPGVSSWQKIIGFLIAHKRGMDILGDVHPDLILAQVLTRHGILAWWLSRRYKVPFLISEHWSRYFPENGDYTGFLRKLVTRFIVSRATAVIVVSMKLKEAMRKQGLDNPRYYVVPNSIDKRIFRYTRRRSDRLKKQIIHVSCFEDKSKDISGFLAAVKQLRDSRNDFKCILVGEGPDQKKIQHLAKEMGLLGECVFFAGLKEGEELIALYQQSDFCVLSSRYETFGTVVIESLACGTPVVATNVGVVPDVINSTNGIIVPTEDEGALRDAMSGMIDQCDSLDRKAIRDAIGDQYSPETVLKQLTEIYRNILDHA